MIWLLENHVDNYVAFLNIEQAMDYIRSLGYEKELDDNWEPIDPNITIWRKDESTVRLIPILFIGDVPKT